MKINKQILWHDIVIACDQLTATISHLPYTGIVTILRGGLVPSCILSYKLNLPILGAVNPNKIMTRSKQDDILIVDDVCNTGKTSDELNKFFPNAHYVALFIKDSGQHHCDYWAQSFPDEIRLVMPWARRPYHKKMVHTHYCER